MALNNSSNEHDRYTQFSNMMFRILVGVVFAGVAAWGAYINTRVNEVDIINNDTIWIKQDLRDIKQELHEIHNEMKEQNAQRHNP